MTTRRASSSDTPQRLHCRQSHQPLGQRGHEGIPRGVGMSRNRRGSIALATLAGIPRERYGAVEDDILAKQGQYDLI